MLKSLLRWFKRAQSTHYMAIAVRHGRVNLAIMRRAGASAGLADDALVVNDEEAVAAGDYAAAISKLLSRYEKLGLRKTPVQVVLGPMLIHQVIMDRPQVPDEEMAAALPWSLKELVDIPASDVIADYYEPAIQASGRNKIHVVAVQRSWLLKVIQPLLDARLEIGGIINEDLALTRLFKVDDPPLVLLTQYAQEQAQLLLMAQQKLIVSRQLKPLVSLQQPASSTIDTYETDMLALELQRSLDFYSGQLRQPALQHVRLALPGTHARAVAKVLEDSLALKVEMVTYPVWASELAAGDYSDLAALAGIAWLDSHLLAREQEQAA